MTFPVEKLQRRTYRAQGQLRRCYTRQRFVQLVSQLFRRLRDKLLEWYYSVQRFVQLVSQRCFAVCETSCWNGVTLCHDSCNLSHNGVSPLARQVAGMVLYCATIRATCLDLATVFRRLRDKLLEWCYTVQRFVQLVSQRCFAACETSCWNGVTLCNDSCKLSRNGVSPFTRQVTGMVLHCATIRATCFATATAED